MLYQADEGRARIALTGDTLITRRLSLFTEPAFLALRDLLLSADVRFTNAEVLFHTYENSPGLFAGTYMQCDPALIQDLQWLGINLVSSANNHAYDYGEQGVLTNLRHLEQAGMPSAGTGSHLSSANAPTYVETPNGRVALVAGASPVANATASRAGKQRHDFGGRPGTNIIDFFTDWVVDQGAFDALKRISEHLGWAESVRRSAESGYIREFSDTDSLVHFLDQTTAEARPARFVSGNAFGQRTFLETSDLERNVRWVHDASRMADFVLFSMHCHEGGASVDIPADHIRELAHAVIDAGADVFVGHGPHQDRGIEIFQSKPIFYGLGNFIVQNDTVGFQPEESYSIQGLDAEATPADFYDARSRLGTRGQVAEPVRWESFVAVVAFNNHQLNEISLYPIDLGFGRPRYRQGRPLLASGPTADRVLTRLQALSQPFGTVIDINGDVGTVRVD